MAKSVEEPVEDWAKKSLDDHGVAHNPKNAAINHEIGEAMKKFPSKKGGKGPMFDHIVIGGESFVSIRSLAMLPFAGERQTKGCE